MRRFALVWLVVSGFALSVAWSAELAGVTMDDQVTVGEVRDAAGNHDAVDADPRPGRFAVFGEFPRRRKESSRRVLRVDPEFDGVSRALDGFE